MSMHRHVETPGAASEVACMRRRLRPPRGDELHLEDDGLDHLEAVGDVLVRRRRRGAAEAAQRVDEADEPAQRDAEQEQEDGQRDLDEGKDVEE